MPISIAPYDTVPAWIYGITREIWEDRGVGEKLARYYAPDIVLRAPTGLTVGNDGVVAQTLATLHQFPDRQLVGEDVVWTHTPGDAFLSSHRLVSVMTHLGDGAYGAAQGRAVRSRIIADCWVQDGQVKEEWLVRDQSAFARCLGIAPRELAQRALEADRLMGRQPTFYLPEHDRPGACRPGIADDPAVHHHVDSLQRMWGQRTPAAIRTHYFEGAELRGPGNLICNGHTDIDRFLLGWLAAFPDATFSVDNAFALREPERPVRLAVRWSLRGTHTGYGQFGPPSGAPVYVMAIAHSHVSGARVHAEWLAIDEVSVWKQILAHGVGQATDH